jgi:hypothetical protein
MLCSAIEDLISAFHPLKQIARGCAAACRSSLRTDYTMPLEAALKLCRASGESAASRLQLRGKTYRNTRP